jgi:hypothetical protein
LRTHPIRLSAASPDLVLAKLIEEESLELELGAWTKVEE